MYDIKPNLIFGFHGCDESVRDRLLNQPDEIVISKEKYDWLGHGMYFWENNYQRALLWAEEKKRRGQINKPAVIGAVLFLGHCCDFLDSTFILFLKKYYNLISPTWEAMGRSLPQNKDLPHDQYNDRILRELDCMVIEFMHDQISWNVWNDTANNGFSKRLFSPQKRDRLSEMAAARKLIASFF